MKIENSNSLCEALHDQVDMKQLGADDEEDKESLEDHANKIMNDLETWKDINKTSCGYVVVSHSQFTNNSFLD
jgi:uncharacterized protein YgfB (UPF0149 family)